MLIFDDSKINLSQTLQNGVIGQGRASFQYAPGPGDVSVVLQ